MSSQIGTLWPQMSAVSLATCPSEAFGSSRDGISALYGAHAES